MIIQLLKVFVCFESDADMPIKNFRINCPAMSGNAISSNNFVYKGASGTSASVPAARKAKARAGTSKIDSRFEKTLAKIAFELCQPDTAVKTTAEDTVVGKIASKQKPSLNSGSKKNVSGKSKSSMTAGNRR